MTDVKQLPDNLEQLEQMTEFKRVYKKYTVDQLEYLLTEAEVDYLSADNKSELTWRLLDHRNFDFEAVLAEANGEQSEPQDAPADEPTDEQPVQQDEPTDTPADAADPAPADEPTDEPTPQKPWFQRRSQSNEVSEPTSTTAIDNEDYVEVLNVGAFPFFETATSTLVPAKKKTKIYPTPLVGVDQIMRNVKQYNHTRGNKLCVLN